MSWLNNNLRQCAYGEEESWERWKSENNSRRSNNIMQVTLQGSCCLSAFTGLDYNLSFSKKGPIRLRVKHGLRLSMLCAYHSIDTVVQIKARKCMTALPKAVKNQDSSDLYLPFRRKKNWLDFISSDFKFEVCGWPCWKTWNKERNGGWLEKWNEIVGSKSKRVLQNVSKAREWWVFQVQVFNPV